MNGSKPLHVTIPVELYEKIKKEADQKRVSMASVVRIMASEYFDRKETAYGK